MEKKERNLTITRKKLAGATITELTQEYRTTASNINRIISDTKAKYPDELKI